MKKFIKHSSVVVAALLAAASIGAATSTVKAATTDQHYLASQKPTQTGNEIAIIPTFSSHASNNVVQSGNISANLGGNNAIVTFTPNNSTTTSAGTDNKSNVAKPNTPAQTTGNQSTTNNTATTTPSNNNQSSTTTTTGNTSNATQGTTTNTGSTTTNNSTTTTNNGTQTTTNSNTTANNNTSANNSSTSTSQQPADNNSNSANATTSTETTSAAKPVVRVAQRSYVYTKNGKIAKKNGKRVVLKKSTTRSLSNAKLVTIKGQKYYQIGKNQYVKASSVIAPIEKTSVKAVVKGRKNAKVRAYTSTGKRTRKYLSGRKSYKFTARRNIKGKTYYKVSGKNLWIPASKLTIR